jgi:hypothetical protein
VKRGGEGRGEEGGAWGEGRYLISFLTAARDTLPLLLIEARSADKRERETGRETWALERLLRRTSAKYLIKNTVDKERARALERWGLWPTDIGERGKREGEREGGARGREGGKRGRDKREGGREREGGARGRERERGTRGNLWVCNFEKMEWTAQHLEGGTVIPSEVTFTARRTSKAPILSLRCGATFVL